MGGGSMRAMAKAAALGGYLSAGPLSGRAAALAGRRAPMPDSATVSTAEGRASIAVASSDKGIQEAIPASSVQRATWETDDWEFAGWAEPDVAVPFDSLHPAPRLVFGPAPTLEEAKEATSDLKNALDDMYFSPSSNSSAIVVSHETSHHDASTVVHSLPRHVAQTFALFQESHEVQDVVASIASDENMWDALMKNKKVVEFYSNHKSIAHPPEPNLMTKAPPADTDCESSASTEETKSSQFADFVHRVKVKVVDVVRDVSEYFQDLFETSAGTSSSASKTSSHGKQVFDFPTGASLMALSVTIILLILIKRA